MRIIFHIGAGKTGTSSIQKSLLNSSENLARNGIKYLGLMLEHAPVKLYAWQLPSAVDLFQKLGPEEAGQQVEEVLRKTADVAEKSGIHTLIWSNEWFFGRHPVMLKPMVRLKESGYDVHVIAYVRRHDAWAKSAYSQWGIKHKTYQGKIIPFREYIKERRVGFSGSLLPWAKAFDDKLSVRNFDAIRDAVADFCNACGIDRELINEARVNDSPGPEELVLRALFNDRRGAEVMPSEFERLFRTAAINFKRDPVQWLSELLPTEEDLKNVELTTKPDQQVINELLEKSGQPKLMFEKKNGQGLSINQNIAYSILFQILEQQAIQLQALRREVQSLKNQDS